YGYDAAGQLTGLKYGNGIYASMGYSSSNREQLSCLDYSTTNRNGTCTHDSTTKFGLNYLYSLDPNNCRNGAPGNDGQIQCITDSVDSGRTANYTYDALGRLSTALTNGSTGFPQWGYTWTYDQYGNRLCQNLTAGNGYQGCLSFAYPGGAQTNQPDGWCFDASGNLLAKSGTCPPTAPNFVYDGENRMVADPTAGATYVYDGNGTRVQKCLPNCTSPSSSTVFVFSGSQDIAEYDNGAAPASPSREFVYSDGQPGSGLLATLTGGSSPTVTYFHDDHLSWRISTDGTPGSPTYGQVNGSQGSYPFGDSWYSSNGNEFAFTSYQRDSESGLDYAMARYYDSTAARFCSADPVGGQLDDPQTWDRYTYVRNDPIDLTDPSGQSWWNWVIDAVIGALAIALPELDPALFSFTGETSAVTAGSQIATETVTLNGQFVNAGIQIFTSNVSTMSFAAVAGAAAALGTAQQSETPAQQLQQGKSAAQERVKQGPCKSFVESLQAKLNKGTAGIGNSSATSFASRIGKMVPRISSTPSQEYPNALAVTARGTYNATFYPRAFSPGVDLAEVFVHETFHAGRFAKGDIDIYKAMTAGKPHIPLTGTTKQQTEQASRLWDRELQKNCGSAGAQ
ncbi:MAG: RHS repeat-associated core domain-containing protein, partial [Candidatus Acidiferrales bacterium]